MNYFCTFTVILSFCWCFVEMDFKYIGGYYRAQTTKPLSISDINPHLVTHIYYSFVEVTEKGSLLVQNENKGYVQKLAKLKDTNPDLKLLFSLVTIKKSLSTVIADKELRQTLIKNGHDLVKKSNFDGLDIDWEFPSAQDKDNLTAFVKELSQVFKEHGYLVTAAVNPVPFTAYGYDVPELTKYLDIINIMTYNFYGPWSEHTGLMSGLYPSSLDSFYERKFLSVDSAVKSWIRAKAEKSKLAVGIPFHGRAFVLKNATDNEIHSPFAGSPKLTTPTYYQILKGFNNYTKVWDDEQRGYYMYSDKIWVTYEEEKSISHKCKYVIEEGLKGVFVWHMGADDIQGEFTGVKQHLFQVINDSLID